MKSSFSYTFLSQTSRSLAILGFVAVTGICATVFTPTTSLAAEFSGFSVGSEYMNESDALDVRRRPQPRQRYVQPQYYGDDGDDGQVYVDQRYAAPQYYRQPVPQPQPQYGYDQRYGRGGYGRDRGYEGRLPGSYQRSFDDPMRGQR